MCNLSNSVCVCVVFCVQRRLTSGLEALSCVTSLRPSVQQHTCVSLCVSAYSFSHSRMTSRSVLAFIHDQTTVWSSKHTHSVCRGSLVWENLSWFSCTWVKRWSEAYLPLCVQLFLPQDSPVAQRLLFHCFGFIIILTCASFRYQFVSDVLPKILLEI